MSTKKDILRLKCPLQRVHFRFQYASISYFNSTILYFVAYEGLGKIGC